MATKYYVEVRHEGLGKFQVIQGTSRAIVEGRAHAKRQEWEHQWEKRLQRERERQLVSATNEMMETEAATRTKEAQEAIEALGSILSEGVRTSAPVDFDRLTTPERFPESAPVKPSLEALPPKPQIEKTKTSFADPSRGRKLLEALSPALKRKRLSDERNEARDLHHRDEIRHRKSLEKWRLACTKITRANERLTRLYENDVKGYSERKRAFDLEQKSRAESYRELQEKYLLGDPSVVEEYFDLALSLLSLPEVLPHTWTLEHREDTRTLVIDYRLPAPSDMPVLKEVNFLKTKKELREKNLPVRDRNNLYDSTLYQVSLRIAHFLFVADTAGAIEAIAFNGGVRTTDAATGHEIEPCILSLHVKREELIAMNLLDVDPKACFKKLKGVGSSKLHAIAPVPPIVSISVDRSRFVPGQEILDRVDEGVNLAAMDWEDFEHLVRELFEKEFAAHGAEVSVTRASRDGGIDAVVIDPDPIRGGKFVIQAKRYTNPVGVSAVRDLYGTMLNEGAGKGILVTTSSFGPDAYNFAGNKPLTLLDGSNLLHLLLKHGTKAHIDVKAAKDLLA